MSVNQKGTEDEDPDQALGEDREEEIKLHEKSGFGQLGTNTVSDISETSSPKKGNATNGINEAVVQGKNTVADNSFSHPPIKFEHELLMRPLPILDVSYPVQEESSLIKAFKRQVIQAKLRRQNEGEGCPHSKVDNWTCQECNCKVSSFGCTFDSFKGKVNTFVKVVYENQFLEDFQAANNQQQTEQNEDDGNPSANQANGSQYLRQSSENLKNDKDETAQQSAELLYHQYQPQNTTELREYMLFLICKKLKKQFKHKQSILGPGHVNHLSSKLINYLQENEKTKKKLLQKYNNEILMFDSIFESGNLLQAELVSPTEYQLYMQVDTNTRGHQQWFYFRVRNTKKDRKYTFKIMNFTKSGLTLMHNMPQNAEKATIMSQNQGIQQPAGGPNPQSQPSNPEAKPQRRGASGGEHLQKIHFKSKLSSEGEWQTIDSDQLEFVKTNVQRRRKDILAAAADSDEEMMEDDIGVQLDSQKLLKQKSPKKKKPQFFYALQFEVQFNHANDSVYFAYALPFSFSEITEKLLKKEAQLLVKEEETKQPSEGPENDPSNLTEPTIFNEVPNKQQMQGTQGGTPSWQENGATIHNEGKCIYYKREIMARSICGLPIYQITIGRDSKSLRKNPVVIITSRVHAAETPSSFVFDGIYNFLCSGSYEAKFLRRFYTFVLIPTLNPDGVVCGNYRSSISGVDLNRQWIQPDEEFHPEIYSIKNLLKTLSEKERKQLWIYCDLHGHSKKKNSFFYGCNTAANGGFLSWTIVRLLPRIFAQKTHLFNYKDCRFKVEPYKLGTGRVVAWKQFMITHSFTLESSFYGYDFGEDEHRHFTHKEYADVGAKFCSSIYELHFLWKSIRNELKLTNGWLKPRKLIEITGVPAAQLLSEELQKKKKEEQKRKSIEQYEQFLKRFFNKSDFHISSNQAPAGAQSQPLRRASKLVTQQAATVNMTTFVLGQSNNIQASSTKPRPSLKNAPIELGKSRNNVGDLNQGGGTTGALEIKSSTQPIKEFPNSEEQIYRLLLGLVKIQALIRGFLTRKRVQPMMAPLRIRLQRNNQAPTEDDIPFLRVTNPLRQTDLAQLPSVTADDKVQGMTPGGINWRNFFQDQELESAYQHVEIEKEDDPDDTLSDGSSSNPSQDNFDLQEMYEQIYQLPKGDAMELRQRKREAKNRFLQEINDQDYIDQQSMFQVLDGAFKGKRGQIVRNTVNTLKSKVFKHGKNNRNELKVAGTSVQISPEKALLRRPSLETRDLSSVKKTENMSPIQRQHNTRNDDLLHPIKSYNLDQNRLDKNLTSQTRIQTGNPQKYHLQSQGPQSTLNPSLQSMQYKLESRSNQAGVLHSTSFHGYGKKESIQQVIKDCFITKKIGGAVVVRGHGNPQQTASNFFPGGEVPSRVHSLNTHKQQHQSQTSNTMQHIKKQQVQRNSTSGGGQNNYYVGKTPAQRLQDQRDQIRHYFKQHGAQHPMPSTSYEKYRALVINNGLIGEHSIPMQNINHYGGDAPPNQEFVASSQSRLDASSMTSYGGGIFGGPNSLPTGYSHDAQTTSSLFMKYVKQKLVKKSTKVETIPQQVADQYIDIYKELIEQEAKKKQEEQEFIRKHQSYGFAPSVTNSFGATGMIGNQGGLATSSISNLPGSQFANNFVVNSRNTSHMQSKSEQKSRSRKDGKHFIINQTNTSRKDPLHVQPLVIPQPQQLFYLDDQSYARSQMNNIAKPRGIDEVIVVRASVNGPSVKQPSQQNMFLDTGYGPPVNMSRPRGATNGMQIVPCSSGHKIASSQSDNSEPKIDNQNVRFPNITTLHPDKKPTPGLHEHPFFQGPLPASNLSIHHQSPSKPHPNQPPLTNSMIQQQHHQATHKYLQQQQQQQMNTKLDASARRLLPQQQDSVMDSSVDEEMLDKIKNIYSEMRNPSGTVVIKSGTGTQKQRVIMKAANGTGSPVGLASSTPGEIYSNNYHQRGNGEGQTAMRNTLRPVQSTSSSGIINNKSAAAQSQSDRRQQQ